MIPICVPTKKYYMIVQKLERRAISVLKEVVSDQVATPSNQSEFLFNLQELWKLNLKRTFAHALKRIFLYICCFSGSYFILVDFHKIPPFHFFLLLLSRQAKLSGIFLQSSFPTKKRGYLPDKESGRKLISLSFGSYGHP